MVSAETASASTAEDRVRLMVLMAVTGAVDRAAFRDSEVARAAAVAGLDVTALHQRAVAEGWRRFGPEGDATDAEWPELGDVRRTAIAFWRQDDRMRREYIGVEPATDALSLATIAGTVSGVVGLLVGLLALLKLAAFVQLMLLAAAAGAFAAALTALRLRTSRLRAAVTARANDWSLGRERPPRSTDPDYIQRRQAEEAAVDRAIDAATQDLAPTWLNIAFAALRRAANEAPAAIGDDGPDETPVLDPTEGTDDLPGGTDEEPERDLRLEVEAASLTRLRSTRDDAYLPTTTMAQLADLAGRHPDGATIGVAGERGVGKSVLLRWACTTTLGEEGTRPGLGVLLAFPTRYEPMELITAIVSELVYAVIDRRPDTLVGLATEPGDLRDIGIVERDPLERAQRRRRTHDRPNALIAPLVQLGGLAGVAAALAVTVPLWGLTRVADGAVRAGLVLALGAFAYRRLSMLWIVRWIDRSPLAHHVPLRLLARPPGPWRWATLDRAIQLANRVILLACTYATVKLVAVVAVTWRDPDGGAIRSWVEDGLPDGAHLPAVLGAVALAFILPFRPAPVGVSADDEEDDIERWAGLAQDGQAILERLTYQVTASTETSAGVEVSPAGWLKGSVATSVGTERAERPVTLPEAARLFHQYCARVAVHYGRVVIGIDELDKIADVAEVERFLNDLKALFSVRGTYFLISVSDSAMASFESRGLPSRDAFDSSLDDVLRAEEFDLATLRGLAERRVVGGLPDPFLWMCLALTGGSPRDVLRLVRDLGSVPPDPEGRIGLAHAIGTLADRELRARGRATARALDAAGAPPAAVHGLRELTEATDPWCDTTLRRISAIAVIPGASRPAFDGFATYMAILDTVVRIGDALAGADEGQLAAMLDAGPDDPRSMVHLVAARRLIAFAPEGAMGRLEPFRLAWGLDPVGAG